MMEIAPVLVSDSADSPDPEITGKHMYSDESYSMKVVNLANVMSNENDNVKLFFNTKLPELVSGTTKEKSQYNVLGIGSGPANLSKMPDLRGVSFTWHEKITAQYRQDAKQNNEFKKFDLIHMIQMVYYTTPIKETLDFFISCLSPGGKLIITLITGDCGWSKLYKRHKWLSQEEYCMDLCSEDITGILDTISVRYETHDIDSYFNITECFVEGSDVGGMLLDAVTEKLHFAETAPADIKAKIMEDLQSPEFSIRRDGKILLDTRIKAIVVGSGIRKSKIWSSLFTKKCEFKVVVTLRHEHEQSISLYSVDLSIQNTKCHFCLLLRSSACITTNALYTRSDFPTEKVRSDCVVRNSDRVWAPLDFFRRNFRHTKFESRL
ncbi:hypothetical protein AB205_0118690 [Aquarana catesbeiana]|uniref:Histamine N-methyltransferase n=1 Tax=Aquarana catesbeiana TaxID=8400 RepID=A0A2G9S319_AQUCT|nr:hypothetical protein AB205_0118690 [Aquarana catesbeiana]